MNEVDEVVKEFLVESHEGLDQLDQDLVALEQRPDDRELLARIFRCIHTIKGTCGFLGFPKLEAVTHVGESLLSLLRDGARRLTPERTNALLRLVDAVRQILASIEATSLEGTVDYGELVDTLTALQDDAPPAPEPVEVDEAPSRNLGELLIEQGVVSEAQVAAAARRQHAGDPRRIGEILVEEAEVPPQAIVEALESQSESRGQSAVGDSTIRVDVGLLDKLMNLVGELVLARNQILQHLAATGDGGLGATSQRLNLITTELQEGVMKTRMQPIGNVWNKFPRIVRDLALSCRKQVRIEMDGAETELDRTIIEAIKDPLTHIIRNSVDHGLELPEVRTAAGKSVEGCLSLRAYHEGGQVNIEIADDGKGIEVERVKAKALAQGVITPEQAGRLSEREALNLIFAPGLSTAPKITNVSGRGVGMDVVRTNIERIGGTVDVVSVPGCGTTLKIKIPLTLAIIPALLITTAGDRYAIPQVSLVELVRLEGEAAIRGIETIHGAPAYRLRGNLLPLVYLRRALAVGDAAPGEVVNIVVLQADGANFGLVVDEVNDTEEIVVKPLGKQLKGLAVFAGATIMGDGKVALILDVLGVAQQSRVLSETRERGTVEQAPPPAREQLDRQALLLFRVGRDHRMGVPLAAIARLEEFAPETVEASGTHRVVQYRGEIMPLVRLADLLNGVASSTTSPGPLSVVVHQHAGRSVGLVVDQIIDIVEEPVVLQRRGTSPMVAGSAVIQGHVTDLLDLTAVVARVGEAPEEWGRDA
jgi:two-component system chemotaxis sensor kinase CheA